MALRRGGALFWSRRSGRSDREGPPADYSLSRPCAVSGAVWFRPRRRGRDKLHCRWSSDRTGRAMKLPVRTRWRPNRRSLVRGPTLDAAVEASWDPPSSISRGRRPCRAGPCSQVPVRRCVQGGRTEGHRFWIGGDDTTRALNRHPVRQPQLAGAFLVAALVTVTLAACSTTGAKPVAAPSTSLPLPTSNPARRVGGDDPVEVDGSREGRGSPRRRTRVARRSSLLVDYFVDPALTTLRSQYVAYAGRDGLSSLGDIDLGQPRVAVGETDLGCGRYVCDEPVTTRAQEHWPAR